MGAITRSIANNITTGGVFTSSAITNASVTGITVLANAEDGITLISSQTASNSASISFTSGLTSTYKAYKFVFIDINFTGGSTSDFFFQGSTNGGSSYGVNVTSTFFDAYNFESTPSFALRYLSDRDLAQSTSFQPLAINVSNNNADGGTSGTLTIFNPSSTTYVKHFIGQFQTSASGDFADHSFPAGYFNTTSAINAFQFKMGSGNMDGKIYLYGIK
jgi:hypothetical protein